MLTKIINTTLYLARSVKPKPNFKPPNAEKLKFT